MTLLSEISIIIEDIETNNWEDKMSAPNYRGATPMLNGKKVEIAYETCDGNNAPSYKIKGSNKWYSGNIVAKGYDREIELTEKKIT